MRRALVNRPSLRILRGVALALALGQAGAVAWAQDAGTLRARHASLTESLAASPFGRPLLLVSSESSDDMRGDVYAVAQQPFAVVGPALQGMAHWCDILMLHLNVKDCAWQGNRLSVAVGKKFDQPLEDTYKLDFDYRVASSTADYLQVRLNADDGPLGTRNYRFLLEAIPLDARTSFLHLSYAYGYGGAARLAMQLYLATAGRDKVGFSVVGRDADGAPAYMGGVRGVIERNAMRYYLAIDAYLAATALPRAEQSEKRIQEWITNIERYPRQLHEMERDDYLVMKRKELAQQQASMAGKTSAR